MLCLVFFHSGIPSLPLLPCSAPPSPATSPTVSPIKPHALSSCCPDSAAPTPSGAPSPCALIILAKPQAAHVGMLQHASFPYGPSPCPLQVAVPQADMEEILPAARLLSRATAVTPSDYDCAKTLFLAGLHNAGMQAQVSPQPLSPAACIIHLTHLCDKVQCKWIIITYNETE